MTGRLQGNVRCDQVAHRPPDTEHGEEIARGKGQKFQEQRAIHGQITTNTETQAGEQGTSTRVRLVMLRSDHVDGVYRVGRDIPNPGRSTAGRQTKDTRQEKRHVERRTTSNDVRRETPERSSETETQEQGAGGETDPRGGHVKLHGQLGQGERDTLERTISIAVYRRIYIQPCKGHTCSQRLNQKLSATATNAHGTNTYLSANQPNPQSANSSH